MALITHTRAYHFRSTHLLDGGPAPEALHGHEYRVEVTTQDAPADLVGTVVRDQILTPLHGRQIQVTPATGENIVEWIDARLRSSELGVHLRAVHLRETGKNRFVSARSEDRHV